MNSSLSERDVITKFIIPSLEKAGWSRGEQIREEVSFTAGRVYVRGRLVKRGKKKRADIILYFDNDLNHPACVIEAKDMNHNIGDGMSQALDYAESLDIPVAISSNGKSFVLQYRNNCGPEMSKATIELNMDSFPTPQELWECYKKYNNLKTESEEKLSLFPYYVDSQGRKPRYYQQIAINRTVDAIARGQNRILLVMATGTGKTYTAFQIIYRLWKAGVKKRILYLADRNNLIIQTKKGDFKHFGDKCHIIKNKEIDKSYEIYLALYQGLTNYDEDDAYKQFSSNFFDLIIVDECHRGSVDEDKAWHKILNYFSSATQIGMTATPKETRELSNIEYFGEPIYTYSLKDGIDDGFLAPYKVLKVGINVDLEGYVPEVGKKDKDGNLIEERVYNTRDFDNNLVIDERTSVVANKIIEFLVSTNPYDKTIVFCVDIEHAERMRRALLNAVKEQKPEILSQSDKYCVRITGDDPEAKRYLEDFINPEERFPCIATTSKLLTTGVDAKTCKVIALDSNIGSMTEFKQIIGRGTRINEEFDKYYFTIIDFRNVTSKFFEKEFDGSPVKIKELKDGEKITADCFDEEMNDNFNSETLGDSIDFESDINNSNLDNISESVTRNDNDGKPREKVYISGVDVSILSQRRQYLDNNGSLITCSLIEWTKKGLITHFRSLDNFLKTWKGADKKKVIIDELEAQGLIIEDLKQEIKADLDVFDLICHIAFDAPSLTRRERAENVKKRNYWAKYGEKARAVLERLLDKYAENGIEDIEDMKVLTVDPLSTLGTVSEIVSAFGSKNDYLKAVRELEDEIYSVA